MKIKVSEATEHQIDGLVAKCEGVKVVRCGAGKSQYLAYVPKRSAHKVWRPSTNWAQGGPIIEREKIELIYFGTYGVNGQPWEAQMGSNIHYIDQRVGEATSGPTPLIAAMRCYVASKLGEEVEVPNEL